MKIRILYRYLQKEIGLLLLFFSISFFLLYFIIDSSLHVKIFNKKIIFIDLFFYYLWQFSQHFNTLLPLALLLTTIKILTSMNMRGELSALLASALPFKKIYKPFVQVAFFVMLLSYINLQWIQPHSMNFIQRFEDQHLSETYSTQERVKALPLADNALLIFHNFDEEKQIFSHALLVSNFNEIYRIGKLTLKKNGALGEDVDVLMRNRNGKILKKENRERCFFSKISIDIKKIADGNIHPKIVSLSHLFHKLTTKSFTIGKKISDKEAEVATYFSYKLLMPLLSLFVVLLPPFFCVTISRLFPLFFIYAGFLLAFFAFIALTNAVIILSTHQIVPPFWGLFFIIVPLFSICLIRYRRLYERI